MNYIKKIKKCLFCNKNDSRFILCIILSILAVFFLGIFVKHLYTKFMIIESFGNASDPSSLLLLYWKDCGYCKKMMPEWDKFTTSNTTKIKTRMVERKEDPSIMKKYNVKSFPTILLVDSKGGKIKSYDGERTSQAFQKFCEEA